jgi:hypothetical protein
MLELHVFTTDQEFVADLNAADIDGVRAEYRPTMAYDSMEHVCEIVLTAAIAEGLRLAAAMIADRLKKKTPKQMEVDGKNVINGNNNVLTVVNNFIERHDKAKD